MSATARIVARNTLAQAAGKAVVLAAGAVSIAVTTRYLGAAGYGHFALALALLQTLGVLARYRLDGRDEGRWPILRRPAARLEAERREAEV